MSSIPHVTAEAIARTFEPYVLEHFDADSPRWRKVMARVEEKLARPSGVPDKWLTSDGARTTQQVQAGYSDEWNRIDLADQLGGGHASWFEWHDRGMRVRTIGYKRVFQLFLVEILEWLQPESVAEVGFGWGLNLLALALQFPEIHFGGVELTESGVRTARLLAANSDTPRLLDDFLIKPVRDVGAVSRLDLRQGSASALPLLDKSVDMVITVLALEQMERIRESALRELARVARRHVVMIEPFLDWNEAPRQREYIRRHDYWSGALDDLPAFGLVPIAASADIPQKLAFRSGIVVANVEATPRRG